LAGATAARFRGEGDGFRSTQDAEEVRGNVEVQPLVGSLACGSAMMVVSSYMLRRAAVINLARLASAAIG
jgi:hypothetical protein